MSKQFIATNCAGAAHKSDIYSVALCKSYTITASGDGYLKLWKNNVTEIDNPKNNVEEIFVHKTGLHHVAVLEDTLDIGKFAIVAAVSFSGEIFFYTITASDGNITPIKISLDKSSNRDAYWAVQWRRDQFGETHIFGATKATGTTNLWNVNINSPTDIQFTLHTEAAPQTKQFATSLDLSSNNLLATGFQNGDVVLTQIESGKPVYTFRNSGLRGTSQSSSTVRSLKFSPLGKLLAVASDSGSYGTVTVYDTVYGECVGNFTIPTHSSKVSVGACAHDGWVFEVDFNEEGDLLLSAGYDAKVRVWNVATREREATILLSVTDVDDADILEEELTPSAIGAKFIPKGTRGGAGGDNNDGIVVIALDKGIRWYREAGGI